MENYGETINYGDEENPREIPRLFLRQHPSGYGYQIWDRKLKVALFTSFEEDKVKKAIDQLRLDSDLSKLPSTDNEIAPPKVMVMKGKHGDSIYDVSTLPKLYEVSLKIVNQHLSEGSYWYSKPEQPQTLGFTEEEINAFPEGQIKKIAIEQLKKYKEHMTYYLNEMKRWHLLEKVQETQNGQLAYAFLCERSDAGHQYEEFEIYRPD